MIVDIAVGEILVLKLQMEQLAQCLLKRQARFLIQARKRVSVLLSKCNSRFYTVFVMTREKFLILYKNYFITLKTSVPIFN